MSEKKQVLIICQTAEGQMYLGVLLNRIWYAPILARTPEEGVRLAQKNRFALILYDGDVADTYLRPSIALLRKEPLLRDQPLIVFITGGNPALNESLLSQGCSAVLTKPLDLAIVYGVLARLSGQPRSTPRIPIKVRVEIEEGIPEKFLTSVNLSEGGIFLRTVEPLSEGSEIHIKFTLPHDTEQIALPARVVRTFALGTQLDAEPGMGLQYIDIPEVTLMRIRNFVQWEMTGDLEWKSNI